MYFYFSSEHPSAIKINGIFYGILSDAVKPLRVDGGAPFVEICPVSVSQPCINLLLDQNFLTSPPPSVSVTDLKGGYLIKFSPNLNSADFSVLSQQKFSDAIVTVFNENGLKLSIETRQDFYAETLNLNVKSAEITEFKQDNAQFIAINFTDKRSVLCVYKISEKIEKVFCREVEEFDITAKLSTVEKFADIAKHRVRSHWEFNGSEFTRVDADITCSENFKLENLPEKLIPYCFLERRLVGGNTDEYLCQNILANQKHLDGYLGRYIGVMPPPSFRNIEEIGLIYHNGENCYTVEYFKFCLQNRKINNIVKSD